jgi:hypothetical protein
MQLDHTAASEESPPFVITLTWLRRHATNGAGWSRRQIEALGLPYPARAGWLQRVAGKRITQVQRASFETASKTKPGTSTAPRRAMEPASANLGAYVRAFAALARCDSRTNAFLLWLGDSVERLTAGTMSRAERQALSEEAGRFVQALIAATAGDRGERSDGSAHWAA